MSYDEFWEKDYRLIDSFIHRREFEINAETESNWELANWIRIAIMETISNAFGDGKGKKIEYPNKPEPRTILGQAKKKREEKINELTRRLYEEKIAKAKKGEV